MSEDLLELIQLGEILGLSVAISVGIFYSFWGHRQYGHQFYQRIIIISFIVFVICFLILRTPLFISE